MNDYAKNNVYNNFEICDYISKLEKKYLIVDQINIFQNLVNFSKNKTEPCSNWFRYREGYSNLLVQYIIDSGSFSKNSVIVDPFVGSGTTLLVAEKNNINSFGLDVNPISIMLTNFKCDYFNKNIIDLFRDKIKIFNYNQNFDFQRYYKKYESVKKYFSEKNFNELMNIKSQIDSEKNEIVKKFLLIGYLSIIELVSNRRRDGNGLKTVNSKINDVLDFYKNTLTKIVDDISDNLIDINNNGLSVLGSAKNLSKIYFENFDVKADAVIYSPPYANSFDYFESYKLEIVLCDFAENVADINKYRMNAVRSFISPTKNESENRIINLLADEIKNKVLFKEEQNNKKDSRTRKVPSMIKGYFSDMNDVMHETYQILNHGKKCYIVVDQSSYLGVIIPTDLLLCDIAEKNGFKVDKIIVCRKARTSSQQTKKFNYLNNMLRESIVVLERI